MAPERKLFIKTNLDTLLFRDERFIVQYMALQPEDWNVVVLGRWNPALFTPAQISSRIFGLPQGTPIEVYVPIDDVLLPSRVKHDGMDIFANPAQLNVSIAQCSFEKLDQGRKIASDAIEQLPKTPLIAAGFNIRYRADGLPSSLASRFSAELDRRFSDENFSILGRQFHRILAFQKGRLLVRVANDPDEKAEVMLNFELKSNEPNVLREWLGVPIREVRDAVTQVLSAVLELTEVDYVPEYIEYAGSE